MQYRITRHKQNDKPARRPLVARGFRRSRTFLRLSLVLTLALFSVPTMAQSDPDRLMDAVQDFEYTHNAVRHNKTNLIWLKNANCPGKKMKWDDANSWVAKLEGDGSVCGLKDGSKPGQWRLPTVAEWLEMTKSGCTPAISDDLGTGCYTEQSTFVGVVSDGYWVGEQEGFHQFDLGERTGTIFGQEYDQEKGWVDHGHSAYVWPVREDPAIEILDRGYTVTTMMMWEGPPSDRFLTPEGVLRKELDTESEVPRIAGESARVIHLGMVLKLTEPLTEDVVFTYRVHWWSGSESPEPLGTLRRQRQQAGLDTLLFHGVRGSSTAGKYWGQRVGEHHTMVRVGNHVIAKRTFEVYAED